MDVLIMGKIVLKNFILPKLHKPYTASKLAKASYFKGFTDKRRWIGYKYKYELSY